MIAISTQTADEAQALEGVNFEWTQVRDGEVVSEGHIFVPDSYYDAATSAVILQLSAARLEALRTQPRKWAEHATRMLVQDGIVSRSDARRVEVMIEHVIRRSIEELSVDSRDRVQTRFPLALRSLIPLIRRSERK